MMRCLTFALMVLLVGSMGMAQADEHPPTRDVAYVEGGGERQQLDVYLPEGGDAPYPTLLLMHGGGFQFGDKRILAPIAEWFAERGYAAVSMNYRLTPSHSFPAPVEDAFCALAWIHANAGAYGFDPQRIVVSGESAGGNLAAMLAVIDDPTPFLIGCPNALPESNWVAGAIPYYPMTALDIEHYAPLALSLYSQYLGTLPGEVGFRDRLAEASAATYIDGTEPPFLILNGEADPLLPIGDAQMLYDALNEAGVNVEIELFPARQHAFISLLDTDAGRQAAERADAWMQALWAESS